ncbi:MAG: peptidase S8 [Sedimentisphaerales bacterium]|nr:peptidase S8 [Sedimentisphaerales bacterium]
MAKSIWIALGVAAVLAALPPAFGRPPCCPDTIIVQFYADVCDDDRTALVEKYQCAIKCTCRSGDFHRVLIPAEHTPESIVELFQAEPDVEYAELNYYADIFAEPNDTYYSFQWHMQNDTTGGIYIEDAWEIETGDPNVIVAVLDTGVAYEDFDRFRQAPDLAGTSFVGGYDFINDDEHPNDDQGHGTHVAGTIGQSTDNGLGVAGVAFGCSIMPIKVLDVNGVGDHFTIARGLIWAADHGAKVINLSLGGGDPSKTLEQAVAYAYRAGVTVVCAAGNDFRKGNAPSFPAAYDDYCIAVGATRYDDRRAPYSNTGSYLDVVAPGGDISVDQNEDGYADGILQQTFSLDPTEFAYFFFQGTSMAAPHVSGVAALLISHGVTHPDDVRQAIQGSAIDAGPPGWDPQYGHGLLNAPAALQYQPPKTNDPR